MNENKDIKQIKHLLIAIFFALMLGFELVTTTELNILDTVAIIVFGINVVINLILGIF